MGMNRQGTTPGSAYGPAKLIGQPGVPGGSRAGSNGLQFGIDERQREIDATTNAVMTQVAELKKLLNVPHVDGGSVPAGSGISGGNASKPMAWGGAGNRGRALADDVSEAGGLRHDPEMERIDAMLDKLIRIQHPELVSQ